MAALAYLREFHFGTVLLRLLFAFLCGGARASRSAAGIMRAVSPQRC